MTTQRLRRQHPVVAEPVPVDSAAAMKMRRQQLDRSQEVAR